MSGLLSQAEAGAAALPAKGAPIDAAPDAMPATPEEEQVMDAALAEVGKIIYAEDEANDAILQGIAGAKDPADMVGLTAMQVVEAVDQKMDLPDDFILPLVEPVIIMLVEMADKAGIIEAGDELIERALIAGATHLAEAYELDPAELQALAADPGIAQTMQGVGGIHAGKS